MPYVRSRQVGRGKRRQRGGAIPLLAMGLGALAPTLLGGVAKMFGGRKRRVRRQRGGRLRTNALSVMGPIVLSDLVGKLF